MKRVRYDGEELIMLDDVADALIRYTLALARVGASDVVSAPTLTTAGSTVTVDLFLHASIHLSSRPVVEEQDSIHPAAAFVTEMELRSVSLDPRLPSM